MLPRKRVLFVDDEPSIRLTLPPVLEEHGFEVCSAASVAQALSEINSQKFDALLSDMNIGEEGDGFLVVDAMRQIQPRCVTVILTGYPAFDTALQALRQRVDDYLVKPADVETLINCLRDKLERQNGTHAKDLGVLLRENSAAVLDRVLEALKRNGDEGAVHASDRGRLAQLPQMLQTLSVALDSNSSQPTPEQLAIAAEHGIQRREQRCAASAIVTDFQFLEKQIYEVIESNQTSMDSNKLVGDLKRMQQILSAFTKVAIAAYEEEESHRMRA